MPPDREANGMIGTKIQYILAMVLFVRHQRETICTTKLSLQRRSSCPGPLEAALFRSKKLFLSADPLVSLPPAR